MSSLTASTPFPIDGRKGDVDIDAPGRMVPPLGTAPPKSVLRGEPVALPNATGKHRSPDSAPTAEDRPQSSVKSQNGEADFSWIPQATIDLQSFLQQRVTSHATYQKNFADADGKQLGEV